MRLREWGRSPGRGAVQGSQLALALGLSFISTEPIVMASTGLLCAGRWLRGADSDMEGDGRRAIRAVREGEFILAVAVSLLILLGARGALSIVG
jgi:hypothetical protein